MKKAELEAVFTRCGEAMDLGPIETHPHALAAS